MDYWTNGEKVIDSWVKLTNRVCFITYSAEVIYVLSDAEYL